MAHKKILAIFLTMCMIVSMAACGNKTEAPAQEETEETVESTEEPAADAAKTEDITDMSGDLEKLGEDIGVIIRCQHEDIFNMMHRV